MTTDQQEHSARRLAPSVLWAIVIGLLASAVTAYLAVPSIADESAIALAALPVLAILLTCLARRGFRLKLGKDRRLNLLAPVIIPALVLGISAAANVSLVSAQSAVRQAFAIASVLWLLAILGDPDLRRQPATALIVFGLVFFGARGALILADVAEDQSPSRPYEATVLGKSGMTAVWSGAVAPNLVLAPWGPVTEIRRVKTSLNVYAGLNVADAACMQLHAGWLKMPWFETFRCLPGSATPRTKAEITTYPQFTIDTLKARFAAGDSVAANELGLRLANGRGVARDPAAAFAWYKHASDDGNFVASFNLAVAYQNGWGVAPDYAAAAALYHRSEPFYVESATSLGYLYDKGLGVPQDFDEARRHYEYAATNGSAAAAADLAISYSYGRGTAQDPAIAFYWYRVAAGRGQPLGMNGVGYAYLMGHGVDRDTTQALAWLSAAAQAGQPNAMQTLGAIFLEAKTARIQPYLAYCWLLLAIRHYPSNDEKLPAAFRALNIASALMTKAERERTDQQTARWTPRPISTVSNYQAPPFSMEMMARACR